MPKAYWVARVDVHDGDAYKGYVAANAAAFARYGGKFLVRGGRSEAPEGTPRDRNVVIEFKDYETAVACYHSPEYAAAKALRMNAAEADLLIIEGYDGPQPNRTAAHPYRANPATPPSNARNAPASDRRMGSPR